LNPVFIIWILSGADYETEDHIPTGATLATGRDIPSHTKVTFLTIIHLLSFLFEDKVCILE
jgi:hypothetical protein